jgi:energy-converting hydrogenase Eha subunit A
LIVVCFVVAVAIAVAYVVAVVNVVVVAIVVEVPLIFQTNEKVNLPICSEQTEHTRHCK